MVLLPFYYESLPLLSGDWLAREEILDVGHDLIDISNLHILPNVEQDVCRLFLDVVLLD